MPGYMTLGYENIFTIILSIIGFIIILWAQNKVSGTYSKMRKIKTAGNLSGQEIARKILDENGLSNVHIVKVSGNLTDHYDPARKVVRLSSDVFDGTSIASVAVAAHECGHAIQDKENYSFMKIRSFLVPIVNFVTYAGYVVAVLSLFAGITGYLKVGIFLIIAAIIFQLVTLPVEFDASARAQKQLDELKLLESDEQNGVYDMLRAAAMTYVASFLSSIINLLRLLIMVNNRNDD